MKKHLGKWEEEEEEAPLSTVSAQKLSVTRMQLGGLLGTLEDPYFFYFILPKRRTST